MMTTQEVLVTLKGHARLIEIDTKKVTMDSICRQIKLAVDLDDGTPTLIEIYNAKWKNFVAFTKIEQLYQEKMIHFQLDAVTNLPDLNLLIPEVEKLKCVDDKWSGTCKSLGSAASIIFQEISNSKHFTALQLLNGCLAGLRNPNQDLLSFCSSFLRKADGQKHCEKIYSGIDAMLKNKGNSVNSQDCAELCKVCVESIGTVVDALLYNMSFGFAIATAVQSYHIWKAYNEIKEAQNIIEDSKELLTIIDEKIKGIENRLKLIHQTITHNNNNLTRNEILQMQELAKETDSICNSVKQDLDKIKININNEVKYLNIYRTLHTVDTVGNIAQGANAIHTLYRIWDSLPNASSTLKAVTVATGALFASMTVVNIASAIITKEKMKELRQIAEHCEKLKVNAESYEKTIVVLNQYLQQLMREAGEP
ncbi:unnamed protein product [Rotaria magnacalcarata]|uniref:Uncharacterized protein n=3 Tax=Rotaria magnacalcarata TaxID=392030 RepID=A0A814HQE8_9BILA|nr:unnamed protein product [Rotaria magnacalcarata]CAF1930100.1 unnamed protein product [Rotaria magnacalcarata]